MKKVILLNKKEGETPLEAMEHFRLKKSKKYPEYKNAKMTYAGRLDPMASGLLLVLLGEETKNKEKYLALEKEYTFQVLFGFSTDTYDILGKVTKNYQLQITNYELNKKIKQKLRSFLGESIQKYPMYSSKTINGKPLFVYARTGEEVKIPERKIFIKKLKLDKMIEINNKKLFKNIEKRIKKVRGDFRQKEILEIWREALCVLDKKPKVFLVAEFRAKCSSGTYVRGIVNSLGDVFGIPALAFSIKRTKLGKYMI
jgi:tRNA pseudouridine55 synthase